MYLEIFTFLFSERITEIIELEIQIEKCWRSRHDIGPELNVYLTHLTVDASLVLPECLIKWAASPLLFSSLVFTRSCNQNELCSRAVRLRLWNEIEQMRETTRISFFFLLLLSKISSTFDQFANPPDKLSNSQLMTSSSFRKTKNLRKSNNSSHCSFSIGSQSQLIMNEMRNSMVIRWSFPIQTNWVIEKKRTHSGQNPSSQWDTERMKTISDSSIDFFSTTEKSNEERSVLHDFAQVEIVRFPKVLISWSIKRKTRCCFFLFVPKSLWNIVVSNDKW